MSETKPESTRSLLAQIEGEWEAPRSGTAKAGSASTSPPTPAELDAAAERLIESLVPPPVSVRNVEELDSGWGDTDDDTGDTDDADDADDANEPALPDERLDPVAYAEAKKARDERVEARRERRRARVEAKKARRKTRVDAQKSKQKGKQRKARAPLKAARPERSAKPNTRASSDSDESDETTEAVAEAPVPVRTRAKVQSVPSSSRSATTPMLSKTNQWMLAVALVVFIAAATFAAVVAR